MRRYHMNINQVKKYARWNLILHGILVTYFVIIQPLVMHTRFGHLTLDHNFLVLSVTIYSGILLSYLTLTCDLFISLLILFKKVNSIPLIKLSGTLYFLYPIIFLFDYNFNWSFPITLLAYFLQFIADFMILIQTTHKKIRDRTNY